jgi:cytidine deaminase
MDDKKLIDQARQAMKRSIAPFSGFRVGAALLAADGQVILGCNIENYSLSLSICAERVAIFKALSEGILDFRKLAIVSNGSSVITPCGACRQMLAEFAPQIEIILTDNGNSYRNVSVSELLPMAFDIKDIKLINS